MEHIDIEVSANEGSILIFTDDGELIEMHVEPSPESIVKAISTRPPASIAISGAGDASNQRIAKSLEQLGHEVNVHASVEAL
jgi:hypothetical protein